MSRPILTRLLAPIATLVVAFAPTLALAQGSGGGASVSPRIRALAEAVAAGRTAAVGEFWTTLARDGAPIIEPAADRASSLVTFVYRGDSTTRHVVLMGGPSFSIDFARDTLSHVKGSDVWYRTEAIRRDARFQYKFGPNVDLGPLDPLDTSDIMKRMSAMVLDPLNPRRFPATSGVPAAYVNSMLELSDAPPQPWLAKRPGVTAGKVTTAAFRSAVMKNERQLSVYTPAGYSASAGPYDLLIVFDRDAYLQLIATPTILDNLIAARAIPPLVAVLVGNPGMTRNAELPCNRAFADMLATELVPWVRERYAVSGDPTRATLAGSSYGGLASTCSALFHPERFRNVLSQSGSYWWGPDSTFKEHEWVRAQFDSTPRLPLRFYQDVGLMESGPTPGDGPSMVESNRRLRDVLRSKGYEVHYAEFNGGHEYLNWQGTLADGLIALLGGR